MSQLVPKAPKRLHRWRVRLSVVAALVTAGSLALAGCSSSPASSSASATGSGSGAEKMTFVSYLPLTTLSMAPEMLASTKGFYKKNGLDVSFQTVQGAAVAIQAMLGGSTPVTRVGTMDVLVGDAKGQPLVQVGTVERGAGFRIISSAAHPIKSINDLVGKTIGLSSVGGTSQKTLQLALAAAGHSLKDVNIQVVPGTPASFTLVQQGKIDGYMVGLDIAHMVTAQFPKEAVANNAGVTALPDQQVYAATTTTMKQDKSKITKFLTSIHQAMQYICDPNTMDDAIKSLQSGYSFPSLNNTTVAKASFQDYCTHWSQNGKFNSLENDTTRFAQSYDLLVKDDMVPGGKDPKPWVTNALIK